MVVGEYLENGKEDQMLQSHIRYRESYGCFHKFAVEGRIVGDKTAQPGDVPDQLQPIDETHLGMATLPSIDWG